MSAPPSDEAASTPTSLVADVLVPVAVDTAYSYRVPPHLRLEPGQFVAAPLGTRVATGVVWGTSAGGGSQPEVDRQNARLAAASPAVARFHRLGRPLDALAAWRGAAHGDAGPR